MTVIRTTEVVPPPRSTVGHLAQWAAGRCPEGGRVLNVGAGCDVTGSLRPVLRRKAYLVGVDPDGAIERSPSLHEHHRMTLEEFAPDHRGEFDVVLSVYVLEHVTDPGRFAEAVATALRPGGFASVDFRCYDATDRYAWYLPGPLRWVAPAYTGLAYRLGRPGLMGHLSFCATMPG